MMNHESIPDGNRYAAKVIASDIYSDIAVLQISQNSTPITIIADQSKYPVSSLLEMIIVSVLDHRHGEKAKYPVAEPLYMREYQDASNGWVSSV